jgi:hypothetical protein
MVEFDLFGHEFFESEPGFQSFGDTEKCRAGRGACRRRLCRPAPAVARHLLQDPAAILRRLWLRAPARNILPRLRLLGITEDDLERMTVCVTPAACSPSRLPMGR